MEYNPASRLSHLDLLRVTRMLTSVIIPAYNCEKFLEEAVMSVVAESESAEVEAVIVEDGSTDGTLRLCELLRDRFPDTVSLHRHPGGANRGLSASRNLGIEKARGELIAFLDADDYWLPGRLEKALAILSERPEVDGVCEPVAVVLEDGATALDREHFASRDLIVANPGSGPEQRGETIFSRSAWQVCGILLRRSVFEKAGLFSIDVAMHEDTHMWYRIAAVCHIEQGSHEPVACYRRHGGNAYRPAEHDDAFDICWDFCRWHGRNVDDPAELWLIRDRLIGKTFRSPSPYRQSPLAELALSTRRLASIGWCYPRALLHWRFYKQLKRVLTFYPLRVAMRRGGGKSPT